MEFTGFQKTHDLDMVIESQGFFAIESGDRSPEPTANDVGLVVF